MDKPRGRPFQPGNKFGRGRPKGSQNKAKSEDQRILAEFAPHVIRKCISLAIKGDRTALRLCMERISVPRRGSPIQMNLPSTRTARDIDRAAEMVTEGVRRGTLTLSEAETMMKLLEARSRVTERADFEQRLENLERAVRDTDNGERSDEGDTNPADHRLGSPQTVYEPENPPCPDSTVSAHPKEGLNENAGEAK